MRHYPLFRILTVLTIVLAAAVSEAAREELFSIRLLFGLALIYGASVFIRDYFYKSDTTYFDFDHRGLREPKEDLIIFGTRVEDLAQQSKERRVLIGLVESAGRRYQIYLAWILSMALAIYLNFRPGGVSPLDIIAPILLLSGIYFAPFLSQLLTPTLLSLLLATYTLVQVRSIAVVSLFVLFLLSFVATLGAYRELDSDRANEAKQVHPKQMVRSTLTVVALFVALYFFVDFLLPERNPFRSQITRDPIEIPKGPLSTDKLSRDLAETLLKWQEKTGPQGTKSSDDRPGDDKPGDADQVTRSEARDDSRDNTRDDSRPLRDDSRSGRESKSPSTSKNSPSSNFKPPNGSGAEPSLAQGDKEGRATERGGPSGARTSPGSSDAPADTGQGPSNSDQTLEASGPRTNAANEAGERNDGSGDGTGDGTGRGATDEKGPGNGAGSDKKQDAGRPASPDGKASPSVVAKSREKKIEEIKHRVKVPLEVAKGVLVVIGILVVLLVISKFFSSQKEEDPEKEIRRQQLTERQKKRLQSILSQIRARNLSPDQEVVETYNALLTVFELGHHPREEWLPAEDFSIQIAKSIPPVSKEFAGATARFSKTLYGQKDIDEAELKVFREDVARILRFFQVSVG